MYEESVQSRSGDLACASACRVEYSASTFIELARMDENPFTILVDGCVEKTESSSCATGVLSHRFLESLRWASIIRT